MRCRKHHSLTAEVDPHTLTRAAANGRGMIPPYSDLVGVETPKSLLSVHPDERLNTVWNVTRMPLT